MPRNKNTRAAQGTGTIRKKIVTRKGKEYVYWEARYTAGVDPGTGKQIQKSITGKTQKEVARKLKEITHEIDKGVYVEPQKMALSAWLDTWIAEYVTQSCKPLTVSSYRSQIETHIKPAIGGARLSAISTTQIQKLLNDLTRNKGKAPKTVKNVHGILHKALAQAVKLHYLPYNPASACELPRMKQKDIHPLSEEEIKAFLAEIDKGEAYASVFKVALFTGMREGEICGLSWEDVNFKNGTITVRQQLQKGKEKGSEYYIATTKNDKARTITAAPFVIDILRQEKAEQIKLRPDARFHDLRHTYAVMSLQEGDDLKTVQENLGHATASFTLDVYGHVSEKMKQDSAARMEKYIAKIKA